MADPIADQLAQQGLMIDPQVQKPADHWQRKVNAISDLYISDLLTDAEASRAKRRLVKQITKHIVPLDSN